MITGQCGPEVRLLAALLGNTVCRGWLTTGMCGYDGDMRVCRDSAPLSVSGLAVSSRPCLAWVGPTGLSFHVRGVAAPSAAPAVTVCASRAQREREQLRRRGGAKAELPSTPWPRRPPAQACRDRALALGSTEFPISADSGCGARALRDCATKGAVSAVVRTGYYPEGRSRLSGLFDP